MDELREIVDLQSLERLFLLGAILLPLLGAGIGFAWGSRRNETTQGVRKGLLLGLLGTLNWVLWKVYNLITSKMGLDTVRNVVVNGVLFIVAGVVLGILLRRWMQNHDAKP
jgi:hypothetical protein